MLQTHCHWRRSRFRCILLLQVVFPIIYDCILSWLHSHGATRDSLTLDGCICHIGPHSSLVAFPLDFYLPDFPMMEWGTSGLSSLGVSIELLVFVYVIFSFLLLLVLVLSYVLIKIKRKKENKAPILFSFCIMWDISREKNKIGFWCTHNKGREQSWWDKTKFYSSDVMIEHSKGAHRHLLELSMGCGSGLGCDGFEHLGNWSNF